MWSIVIWKPPQASLAWQVCLPVTKLGTASRVSAKYTNFQLNSAGRTGLLWPNQRHCQFWFSLYCDRNMFGILFRWRKASKCKKLVRRVQCRLKFLKIKRLSIIKQSRQDIVDLLRSGQPETAFSHAEEHLKDQSLLTAYDLLEHFCEFVILHLPYIRKHKNCPKDINEAVSTLIFAAAWCGDLPELQTIRKLFEERYGSKFIKAISELHPGNHVNSQVKETLCLKSIPDTMKLSLIVELAKDHAFLPEHTGSNRRLGSNVLLLRRNDNLHWEGFLFEGMAQGDDGITWLAKMQLPRNSEEIQAKLPGQIVEVGNSALVKHRYETEMVCNKLSGQGSLESFGSNHPSTTSFGNKMETTRTSSQSEFLVQFNRRTFDLEEVEEIHINTLQDHYAGEKTIFLFNSTLLSATNNFGFSGASLLVSSHCCYNNNHTGKAGLRDRKTCLAESCRRKRSNSMMLTGIFNLKEGQLCHSCLSPVSSVTDISCDDYYGKSGNLSSYQKHIHHGTCPQDRLSRKDPSKDPLLGLPVAHCFKQEACTEVSRNINCIRHTRHSVGEFQNDILIKKNRKLGEAEVAGFPGNCASSCDSCSSGSNPCIETNRVPHQSSPWSMTIAPERVKKTSTDYGSQSDSSKLFQNSKGINSSSCRHVHPKLPDYDELVAKFKALKQELQQRGRKAIKT
ncbi:Vacuolar protein sorting-associated protein Ist1 - like 7 [Theobroma cacao]|nr:Vacuolar protein sorting-associated protein Ist1 - like 7 [Theobroma cacao]